MSAKFEVKRSKRSTGTCRSSTSAMERGIAPVKMNAPAATVVNLTI